MWLTSGVGLGWLGKHRDEISAQLVGVDISAASLAFVIAKKPGLYDGGMLEASLDDGRLSGRPDHCSGQRVMVSPQPWRACSHILNILTASLQTGPHPAARRNLVATQRTSFWDNDERGCRSASEALESAGGWTLEYVGSLRSTCHAIQTLLSCQSIDWCGGDWQIKRPLNSENSKEHRSASFLFVPLYNLLLWRASSV